MTKPRSAETLMRENMLVKHLAGSHAYGTALPTSDVDYRGVFCADPINYLTPFFPVREVGDSTEEDTKYYEMAHFVRLCVDCNPNIIETLWVEEEDIVHTSEAYKFLRGHREEFLSSKIAFTTSGYAAAQLKRIKGHNKWISNPQPEEPPKPCEYLSVVRSYLKDKNLKLNQELDQYRDDHRLIPYGGNLYGVVYAPGYQLWSDQGSINDKYDGPTDGHTELMLVRWNKQTYNAAKEKHQQYWQWKNNRNEVRSELEEHHGYDTKHAMHLVRLMRMGEEALTTGQIIVKRPDAKELLEVRNGAMSYDEIVAYAEEMDRRIRDDLYKKTHLRKKVNLTRVAQIIMEAQDIVWKES